MSTNAFETLADEQIADLLRRTNVERAKQTTPQTTNAPTTVSELNRIMQSDPFYDPKDSRLDTRGMTLLDDVTPVKPDPFQPAPEAKMLTRQQRERLAVKDRGVVVEAIDALAEEGHWTPEQKKQVFAAFDPERVSTFHVDDWTCNLSWQKNKWCVTANDGEETMSFSLPGISREDRDSALTSSARILRKQSFDKRPWRDLTPSELITIRRIAAGGTPSDMESAIYTWLNFLDIREDISSDPRYQELCDTMCTEVFRAGHIEIDDEAWEWMLNRLQGQPLTISILWKALELWQDEKRARSRDRGFLFNPPTPEAETPESIEASLNDLSDDQIKRTLLETRKLAAQHRR
jgi:hypothetical protein